MRSPATLLLLLGALGCGSTASAPAATYPPAAINLGGMPLTFEVVPVDQPGTFHLPGHFDSSGFPDEERLVVRSAEGWSAAWARVVKDVEPKPAAPAIDFEREMVVLAAAGRRGTGGDYLTITGAATGGATLQVGVVASEPGSGCVATAVITYPAMAVRLPRTDAAVAFVERQDVFTCE